MPPALDFPASPTVNQQYPTPAVPGVPVYTWDGEKWTTKGGAIGSTGGADDPPPMDGVAGAGSSTQWAREDHVHPIDTSRAALTYVNTQDALKLGAVRHKLFTASGTYTPDANLIAAIVEVSGGGGGGGAAVGSVGSTFTGGGGGGGGYCRKYLTKAQIGASQTITVGAGGNGTGGTGGNGSASSFGSACIASGGIGGIYGAAAALPSSGAGGSAGAGDFGFGGMQGSAGVFYQATNLAIGGAGNGGSSFFGPGGTSLLALSGNFNGGQSPTAGYGGGGSGASAHNNTAGPFGGNGAPGVVIVTEFCSQ